MRVLFVLHDRRKSGANRSLLELVDALTALGVECCASVPGQGAMTGELAARGVPYVSLVYKRWMSSPRARWKSTARLAANVAACVPLSRKIDAWGVDVVHTNSSVTPVGAMAARLAGKPHIWHIREFGHEDFGLDFDWGSRVSLGFMRSSTVRFIAVSSALRAKYAHILGPDRVEVIHNPVSVPLGDGGGSLGDCPSTQPRLVLVGTLTPGKGQTDAVMAVADLAERGVYVTLDLVGDGQGAYRERILELARECGVEEQVHLRGYVDNPFGVGADAQVHLVCSRAEGFGRATVEAMLLGKPVVAARGGGTLELVKEGVNGFLYEPGHHAELAQRIQYLLSHPSVATEMGRRGRRWARETFAPRRHAQQVLSVYEQVLATKEAIR